MAAEEGQLVREAADEGGRAGEDAVVAMRSARGRKRKQGWQSVGSEEMLASENLRQAAQRWLKQHGYGLIWTLSWLAHGCSAAMDMV